MSNAERLVGTGVDALLDCAPNGEDAINSPKQKTADAIKVSCLQILARKIFIRNPNPGSFHRAVLPDGERLCVIHVGRCLIKRREVSLHCYVFLSKADDTYQCIGRLYCCFKIGCVAFGDRDGFSRTLEKRSASLYFSTKHVTKATTVRASTSSTSHITIVGLNIVDPFRTLMPTADFQSSYLRRRCLRLMDTGDTHVLFRFSPIQPRKPWSAEVYGSQCR